MTAAREKLCAGSAVTGHPGVRDRESGAAVVLFSDPSDQLQEVIGTVEATTHPSVSLG